MYLCYVDESGYTGKKYDENQPIQVMVGVLVDFYRFHRTDNQFKEIFNIVKQNIPVKEIKGQEIYRGRKSWSKINHKIRDKVIDYYLNWVSERKHKIIISVIDNKKFFDLKTSGSYTEFFESLPYPWILSAFHISLVIQKENRKKKKNKGKTLLIFDEEDTFEDKLQNLIFEPPNFIDDFVEFDQKQEKYRLNQILDSAYFVKSHYSSIAQVADILAFLLKIFFELKTGKKEKYNGEKAKIENWISKIKPLLIKYSKVYPKNKKKDGFLSFLNGVKPSKIAW